MNEKVETAEHIATEVHRLVQRDEPGLRKLDRGLADKVKKMGEAATEVTKHIRERRGPTTG